MLSRARRDRPSDLHEVAEVLEHYTDARSPAFGVATSAPPRDSVPEAAAGEGVLSTEVTALANALTIADDTTSTGSR
jgi:hypothetical protein